MTSHDDAGAGVHEAHAVFHAHEGNLDTAASFAAAAMRLRAGEESRVHEALTAILLATIHVRAGEPDGARLAARAIEAVTALRSARARHRLTPLREALSRRGDSTSHELAQRVHQLQAA